MYERILVPTDGSPLSVAAALHAFALARMTGSELIALQVIAPYQFPIYLEYAPTNLLSEQEYVAQCKQSAAVQLDVLARRAAAAGLKYTGKVVFHGNTAQAIIDVADQEFCQLIAMGSHGRSGLSRMFLGSVASKILTLSHIPVLVHKATQAELAEAETLMPASKAASGATNTPASGTDTSKPGNEQPGNAGAA